MRMNEAPERPPIPTIAWFAAAMCAAAAAAEMLAWKAGLAAAVVFAAASTAITLGAWAGRRSIRHAGAVAVVLVACAGATAGASLSVMQFRAWEDEGAIVADCGAREWTGVVEADAMEGQYGAVVRVRIRGGPLDGAHVRVGWPEGECVPDLGRTVRFSAILKPLPRGEPWARRVARSGVCATGTAWRAETGAWRSGPLGSLFAWRAGMLVRMHDVPGVGGDLAEGIVLGDRRRLIGTDTEEDFRILGLTHLVAVSGSHLAAACAAVAFIGTMLRVPRRPLVIATVCAGAVYAVVTGLPYSAMRSLLMLVVGGLGQLVGRRSDGIASLSGALIAVLTSGPWAVFDLGLQLSALAVGGLLLFGDLAAVWATSGTTGWWRRMGQALSLTLVAQFTTVPVVAAGFGMVSLLAPVANLIAGPLVAVAMLVGLAGSVIGSVVPPVGALGAQAAASVLGATAWVAAVLAQLPGAAVALNGGWLLAGASCLCAAVLWWWWPLPRGPRGGARFLGASVVCSLALALGPAPIRQCTVTVLDVGQGDAILVRDSGRTMLVDTGPDDLVLRRALAREGIRRIDVVVLTHAHGDHTGGAGGLVGVTEVGWIGVPGVARAGDSESTTARDPMPRSTSWDGPDSPVRELVAGDRWRVGGTTVEVLWPLSDAPGDLSTNDTSVVLALSRGPFDMVLTGDAEGRVQQALLAAGTLTEVEVLKVPHHGSTNGLTADGLAGWSPNDAIISVGEGNDFGHPAPETLALFDSARVRVFRTDLDGDVTVVVGGSGYRVERDRRGSRDVVRARMRRAAAVAAGVTSPQLDVVRKGPRGSQDQRRGGSLQRVPDLRQRGIVAGSRAPPAQGPHRRGRRPRLQLRGLRRGDRRRIRGRGGREHATVRIRATSRDRARGRPHVDGGPGRPCRVREGPGAFGMSGARRHEDP